MHPKGHKVERLKRVFNIEVNIDGACGGLMKIGYSLLGKDRRRGKIRSGRAGKQRNTDCIGFGPAQSEQDWLQAKGGRGAGLP